MTGLTAQQMRLRLRTRYGRTTDGIKIPEHLVMFEVTVDTIETRAERYNLPGEPDDWSAKAAGRRRIDAVAVGLWTRTRHLVHGFEIKCSRADLLAELKDPQKSEAGWRRCDRWWLALADPKLLHDDDPLPEGWGVLAARGRGLTVVRQPAPMPGERDNRFLAGLLQASLRAHGACRGAGFTDGYLAATRRHDQQRRALR